MTLHALNGASSLGITWPRNLHSSAPHFELSGCPVASCVPGSLVEG